MSHCVFHAVTTVVYIGARQLTFGVLPLVQNICTRFSNVSCNVSDRSVKLLFKIGL